MNNDVRTRKEDLDLELRRILEVFSTQYKPDKVILFGSLVSGKVNEMSDIDILVIKETNKRYWERVDEVVHMIHPNEPIDIFVLTPEEVKTNLEKNNYYLKDILDNGKIIYERLYR